MIEFQNVNFAYEKGKEVLHDMSFRIADLLGGTIVR